MSTSSDQIITSSPVNTLIDINLNLWSDLRLSINNLDLITFQNRLNQQSNFNKIASLKPRLIDETLTDCIENSADSSDKISHPDGCDFIEVLMSKIHVTQCSFVSWEETCKSIVRVYINQKRQFSENTICFLLRCYDLKLLQKVFDYELVDLCFGNCQNWYIMFIASYQERFFSASIENIFEGFMCRFILLSKLRCLLEQKRSFLTWFAGSLHLYADEYFLQSDETRFKNVLAKLFEALIMNGILSNSEFKNFYEMLIKRNEEMLSVLNGTYNEQVYGIKSNLENDELNESNDSLQVLPPNPKFYFPNLDLLYPLTLKNCCRLIVKRSMTKFTRKDIDQLPLPNNLKKFIYFDNECENAFKSCLKHNLA